jgi:glycerate-2-kinase
MTATLSDPTALLGELFEAALGAADPKLAVPPNLPAPPRGRTLVVGPGKAAAAMAQAVEAHWNAPLEGLVVTRYGHAAPCETIEVVEAAHPVPDEAGRAAAERMLDMVQGLTESDLVICLISGGGSALLTLPAPGLTLAHKQEVNRALLRSGADITQMNCVRKHLSAIKGGRLAAAAAPARVVTLIISDVPGGDPASIASGPTVADPTSFADARAILARYGIAPPGPLRAHLEAAAEETPKPGDPRLARAETRLIARPQDSLEAAAARARAAGVTPVILGDAIEGEAREVARVMAAIAPRPAGRAALRAALGRRDHGHRDRPGPRRPQRRVPAGAGDRARRGAGCFRTGLRHRRHRRQRGQRRRTRHPRQPGAGPSGRPRRQGAARRQRRLRLFLGPRRSGHDRPDADQRQRLPRHPGAAAELTAARAGFSCRAKPAIDH